MKILKKILASSLLLAGTFVWAGPWDSFLSDYDSTVAGINSGMDDFATQLSIAIPQAATQQNVWADAYIGKLLPSVPPHLRGGVNLGSTHINTAGLAKAASALNISGVQDSYYYPVFTGDLRIGGLFLPFDLDVSFMKTGQINANFISDITVDFLTLGLEGRYALLEGGVIQPRVSIGFGYFYNQGSLMANADAAQAGVNYKIHTMYVSAQVSKTILFITPFAGVRALVSKCDNTWEWSIKDSTAVTALTAEGKATGGSGSVVTEEFDLNAFQPQFYFGAAFRFLVLDLTASVSTDLRHISDSKLWSGNVSLRVSI